MKILHTSDWHLGQKLVGQSRGEEHLAFLDWLIRIIEEESVELLLVAGDVFDTGNPPHIAQELYYNFLSRLHNTDCRAAVITGGNHDSPNQLKSSKQYLASHKIYVIGGASEQFEDDIIEIKSADGQKTELVVCAVPFLRERDLHYAVSGETEEERSQRIISGIRNRYEEMATYCAKFTARGIPVITTGHLFASGASLSDPGAEKESAEKDIYLGNLGHFDAGLFPKLFSYVALGHIHGQQRLGGHEHIRYSGSPIPLSFSERSQQKYVLLFELSGKECVQEVKKIPVPLHKRLYRFKGSKEDVLAQIQGLSEEMLSLPAFAEIRLSAAYFDTTDQDELLNALAEKAPDWEVLKYVLDRGTAQNFFEEGQESTIDLKDEENVTTVFRKLCEVRKKSEEESKKLEKSFKQLLQEYHEEER